MDELYGRFEDFFQSSERSVDQKTFSLPAITRSKITIETIK